MNLLDGAIRETITLGNEVENGNRFHVAMTGTPNYIPRLGVLMYSILQSNSDMRFSFHVLVNTLPKEECVRLEKLVEKYNCLIYVHLMNDNVFLPLVFGSKTPVFFYRFVVPEVIGDLSDRVLYLDGDMVCRGDIKELQTLDLKNYLAAVVSDRGQRRQSYQMGTKCFFNAGMMLIHTNQWTKDEMFDKVVAASLDALHHIDQKGHYDGWHGATYNDQNILNVLLDGRLLFLPVKYNYIYILTISAFMKKQPRNEDYRKQVIIHFAGGVKPWNSWVQDLPVVREYMKFQKESPWKDTPLVKPNNYRDIHQVARKARIQGKWTAAIKWYMRYLMAKI